jgi:hypothetical protein
MLEVRNLRINTLANPIIVEDDAPADSTPLAVISTPPATRFNNDLALNSSPPVGKTVTEPSRWQINDVRNTEE